VTALTLSFGKTTQYAMMVQTPALTANVLDQYAQYGMLIAVYVHWKNSCVMSVAIGMVSVCRLLIVMNLMKVSHTHLNIEILNCTFVPLSEVNGSFIPAGTACNNFKGYCDNTGKCKTVDNQSPLDDLNNFLSTISLKSIAKWLKQNWPYAVGGFTGMILLLVLFHIVYKRRWSDEDMEQSQTLLSQQDRQKLADSSDMDT
jgi:hypothetical protein